MKKKRITLILISVVCVLITLAVTIPFALAETGDGACGTNAIYTLSGTELVISGTGTTNDYEENDAPWKNGASNGSSITSLVIRDGITRLGNNLLFGHDSLSTIEFNSSTPPTIGTNALSGNSIGVTIKVPVGTVSAYESALSATGLDVAGYTEQVKVTFYANNGSGLQQTMICDKDETVTLISSSYVKTGYVIGGWNTQADGSGTHYAKLASTSFSADTSLYVEWSPVDYTVSFDATTNGGTTGTPSTTVTYDSAYGTLPVASKDGYTFNGWFTAATGGTKVESTTVYSSLSPQDHTLYAQFTADTYSITLEKGIGTADGSASVTYDTTSLTGIVAPTAGAGYTLEGYYCESLLTNKVADTSGAFISSVASYTDASGHWIHVGDTSLYAKWTPNSYTVSFDATTNGGEVSLSNKSVDYNSAYGTLPVASKTGYTFKGWFTLAVGGTKVEDTTIFTQTTSQTLYAQFTASVFAITLDKGLGSSDGSATVTYDGTTLTGITPPTGTVGLVIEGYYKDAELTTKVAGKTGAFEANVTGYTDALGRWIKPSVATLYTKWATNFQEITASGIEATFGDADKTITASVTGTIAETECGALSFAIKSGSPTDVITLNASTGAFSINKAGSVTVTIKAASTVNYPEVTKDITIIVNPKTISSDALKMTTTSFVETEAPITPTYKVMDGEIELTLGTDYEVKALSDTSATTPGNYTITVKGINNYKGESSKNWEITAKATPPGPGPGPLPEEPVGDTEPPEVSGDSEVVGSGTKVKETESEIAENCLTDTEKARVRGGDALVISLGISAETAGFESAPEGISIKDKAEASGYEVGTFFNLEVLKKIGTDPVEPITDTVTPITITVKVPESIINISASVTRSYAVIRYHGGTSTVLAATYNSTDKTLTFKSNLFSHYAIVFKDISASYVGTFEYYYPLIPKEDDKKAEEKPEDKKVEEKPEEKKVEEKAEDKKVDEKKPDEKKEDKVEDKEDVEDDTFALDESGKKDKADKKAKIDKKKKDNGDKGKGANKDKKENADVDKKTPTTGDENPIMLYVAIALLGLIGAIISFIIPFRSRRK